MNIIAFFINDTKLKYIFILLLVNIKIKKLISNILNIYFSISKNN